MKKSLVLLMLVCSTCAFAQVRNIQGMSALGVNGGITGNGFFVGGLFEHILAHRFDMKVEANAEFASYKTIKFNTYNLYLGVDYTYLILGEAFFFKAGGGLTGGLSQLTQYKELNSDLTTPLNYNLGGYLEGQIDIFPVGNLVLSPYFKQAYLARSPFGNWVYNAGLSIKYQF